MEAAIAETKRLCVEAETGITRLVIVDIENRINVLPHCQEANTGTCARENPGECSKSVPDWRELVVEAAND